MKFTSTTTTTTTIVMVTHSLLSFSIYRTSRCSHGLVVAFNRLSSFSTMWKNCRPVSGRCSYKDPTFVYPSPWKIQPFSMVSSTTSSSDVSTSSTTSGTSIYVQEAESLAGLQSTFLRTMRDRGFMHQCTGIVALDEKLSSSASPQAAYLGFDATADSLHVGSLLQIMVLRHLQKSGHKPVVLVGGGTSKVGDPTGKDESRVLLTDEKIQENIVGISEVFDKFLTFDSGSPTDAILVNNNDWLNQIKYLEFLRQYGTQFTVNRMLSFESVKQRLAREAPFTFLEFNYMILQAYDFLELYRRHNCILQLGGSDQWGNMVAGTELGRKVDGAQLFALTAPLITTSDGKKMGKTAGGAVWLNRKKLSEYDYWQFWRNTADDDVIRFLKLFTELPLEQIAELEQLSGADINKAKIILANEATQLLHGPECIATIQETVSSMFQGTGASTEGLPRITISKATLMQENSSSSSGGGSRGGVKILDLLVDLKLVSSKKEARRLIQGGGAKIEIGNGDGKKLDDENYTITIHDFIPNNNNNNTTKEIILRAGKKRAGVVELIE